MPGVAAAVEARGTPWIVGAAAAIATAMVPFLLAAIGISWFGLQRRAWQSGESDR